jgi:hypothetical protein
VNVHLPGQRSGVGSRAERRRRRRSAIQPKIGHLKPALSREGSDPFEAQGKHRMDRCFLAGLAGDAINAVLAAAAGSNLRKLLWRPAPALMRWLGFAIGTPRLPSLLCLTG